MTFRDYLSLIKRRFIAVTIITLMVTGATIGFVLYRNTTPYDSTVFISIGYAEPLGEVSTPYENAEAADVFSQTVMGWFKNPEFIQMTKTKGTTDMSAVSQEKQNVMVNFSSDNPEDATLANQNLQKQLTSEIEAYNGKTNSHFELAVFDANTTDKMLPLWPFVLLGIIAGLLFGIFGSLSYEYLLKRITSSDQLKQLTDKLPVEELPSIDPEPEKLHYLAAFLHHKPEKNLQIIGLNADVKKLTKKLEDQTHDKKLNAIKFPEESAMINTHEEALVVCRLGKSQIEDLHKLQVLLTKHFDLITTES